jgi:hypothetical protein
MLQIAKTFISNFIVTSKNVKLSQLFISDILSNFEQHNWYLIGEQLHIPFKGETIIFHKNGLAELRYKQRFLQLSSHNFNLFHQRLLQLYRSNN